VRAVLQAAALLGTDFAIPDLATVLHRNVPDLLPAIDEARAAGVLVSRLADALFRTGDRVAAEEVASRALEHAAEPDLLIDLHWTLAQCRMRAGESAQSLATLNRALASPGISVRHRARLLVLRHGPTAASVSLSRLAESQPARSRRLPKRTTPGP
jgi:hypothetical protein